MKRTASFLLAALLSCALWAQTQAAKTVVFVKITESILPVARGEKYEDPLDDALRKEGIGAVTGAGTTLGSDGKVESVGLDVVVLDLPRSIPFIRRKLIELGAPRGSTLEYKIDGKTVQISIHE